MNTRPDEVSSGGVLQLNTVCYILDDIRLWVGDSLEHVSALACRQPILSLSLNEWSHRSDSHKSHGQIFVQYFWSPDRTVDLP